MVRPDYDRISGINPDVNYFLYETLNPDFVLDKKNWPSLRRLLGGKGLSLAILNAMKGVTAPQGFTLPTSLEKELKAYNFEQLPPELEDSLKEASILLENPQGQSFADPIHPLAVAVRSGAAYSMPGAMDTILNVGMTTENLESFIADLGEEPAIECYHTFCFDWAASQLMVSRPELLAKIKRIKSPVTNHEIQITSSYKLSHHQSIEKMGQVLTLKAWLHDQYQLEIPDDPWAQLQSSVLAIYRSYYRPEAVNYRQQQLVKPEAGGTAVNVVNMVYGNQGEISGSGVAFSHDPKTGERQTQIEFKEQDSSGAVVAGDGDDFSQQLDPALQEELESVIERLIEISDQAIDLEFVVENGKISFIQFRSLRLTVAATFKLLTQKAISELNLVGVNEIKRQQILRQIFSPQLMVNLGQRFTSDSLQASRDNQSEQNRPHFLAKGRPIGGRANIGLAAYSLAEAKQLLNQGQRVVLILDHLNDVSELLSLTSNPKEVLSIVTRRGSPSSHAAYVLGTENIAGTIGCQLPDIKPGTVLSVDGLSGEVHWGQLALAEPVFSAEIKQLTDERRALGVSAWETIVRANGLEPKQQKLERVVCAAFCSTGEHYQSDKALTQYVINQILPADIQTEYQILSIDQKLGHREKICQQIETAVKAGWRNGHDVSVRSAFAFDKAGGVKKMGSNPWIMLKPGEDERLQQFLFGQLPDWKYGCLNDWFNLTDKHSRLTEVLIGYNHPGKLDEAHFREHAVGVMSSPLTQTGLVEGAIILDTPHLRSFEAQSFEGGRYSNRSEIKFKFSLNGGETIPVLGFGEQYLDQQRVNVFLNRLFKFNHQDALAFLSTEEYSLRNAILKKLAINVLDQSAITKLDLLQIDAVLKGMIAEAEIPAGLLQPLVDPRSHKRAQQIVKQLIERYVKAIAPGLAAVETTMSRLDGVSSGLSLEFQVGFTDADHSDMKWMAVYGLKGLEEWLMSLNPDSSF